MDIANDIEGAVLVLFIVPHPCPDYFRVFQLLQGVDHIHEPEAFPFQVFDGPLQFPAVLMDYPLRIISLRPCLVPFLEQRFWQVQHNGHRMHVLFPGHIDNLLPGVFLNVGRVNNRQLHIVQPFIGCIVKQIKGIVGCSLIVFIIRNHTPEEVRGKDFCGFEVLQGEAGFPGGGCTDHGNQAELRNLNSEFIHFS